MEQTLGKMVLLWAGMLVAGVAAAQTYPAKPVRIVVPYAAGGPYDDIARTLGQRLTEIWGHPLIVENRGGAGGNIGAEVVAKAAPDGYTLLLGNAGPITVNPTLFKKLPYDPQRDLAPVGMLNASRMVLSVHPSLPAKNVKELVALAKASPGKLSFASSGVGNLQHLGMELLQIQAGMKMNHVPYKGAAPAFVDLIAGQVDSMFANIVGTMPHVRTGKLRAIAVTTVTRTAAAPEIPTIAESGVPGYDHGPWNGLFAPAKTPPMVIAKIHAEVDRELQSPDVRKVFGNEGIEAVANKPDEFAAIIHEELVRWPKVVKAAGIKAE